MHRRAVAVIVAVFISGLGILALQSTKAATSVVISEAEQGTLSGNYTVANASGASGQVVRFGGPTTPGAGVTATFPLKISANKRYLIGQNNAPFFWQSDTAWNMPARLNEAETIQYLDARKNNGFNTILVSMADLEASELRNTKNRAGASLFNGGNVAAPNPAYFDHVDKLLALARDRGMQVAIWPVWLQFAVREGSFNTSNATAYGKFLGERYKNTPNIIWTMGGDWGGSGEGNCPRQAEIRALANGIKSTDPNHLATYHSGLGLSSSQCYHTDSWLDFNGTYWDFDFNNMGSAYTLTYNDYKKTPTKPTIMLETAYEGPSPNDEPIDQLYSIHARKQSVYQLLAGAMGFSYGANSTFRMNNSNNGANTQSWQNTLTIPGAKYQQHIGDLFRKRLNTWATMIPDESRQVLVGGNGTYGADEYALASRSADGSLVVAYTSNARTLKIDMSKLLGGTTARWYDMTNGQFRTIAGSPFANSGSRDFGTPGNNASGDGDWFLVLETNPV